jgi:hypothetical protein
VHRADRLDLEIVADQSRGSSNERFTEATMRAL